MLTQTIYTFPKSIRPKVNAMAQLEFEHAYFKATVQQLKPYGHGVCPT